MVLGYIWSCGLVINMAGSAADCVVVSRQRQQALVRSLISHQVSRLDVPPPPRTREFQFGQKKFRFDSIRFSLPNRFFSNRFDSAI